MFILNTLQLYRGGRQLCATEHSPLNATNGGAMGESRSPENWKILFFSQHVFLQIIHFLCRKND